MNGKVISPVKLQRADELMFALYRRLRKDNKLRQQLPSDKVMPEKASVEGEANFRPLSKEEIVQLQKALDELNATGTLKLEEETSVGPTPDKRKEWNERNKKMTQMTLLTETEEDLKFLQSIKAEDMARYLKASQTVFAAKKAGQANDAGEKKTELLGELAGRTMGYTPLTEEEKKTKTDFLLQRYVERLREFTAGRSKLLNVDFIDIPGLKKAFTRDELADYLQGLYFRKENETVFGDNTAVFKGGCSLGGQMLVQPKDKDVIDLKDQRDAELFLTFLRDLDGKMLADHLFDAPAAGKPEPEDRDLTEDEKRDVAMALFNTTLMNSSKPFVGKSGGGMAEEIITNGALGVELYTKSYKDQGRYDELLAEFASFIKDVNKADRRPAILRILKDFPQIPAQKLRAFAENTSAENLLLYAIPECSSIVAKNNARPKKPDPRAQKAYLPDRKQRLEETRRTREWAWKDKDRRLLEEEKGKKSYKPTLSAINDYGDYLRLVAYKRRVEKEKPKSRERYNELVKADKRTDAELIKDRVILIALYENFGLENWRKMLKPGGRNLDDSTYNVNDSFYPYFPWPQVPATQERLDKMQQNLLDRTPEDVAQYKQELAAYTKDPTNSLCLHDELRSYFTPHAAEFTADVLFDYAVRKQKEEIEKVKKVLAEKAAKEKKKEPVVIPKVLPNIQADNKPIPRPEPPKQVPIKPMQPKVPPQAGLNGAPKIPAAAPKIPVPKIPVPKIPVPKKEEKLEKQPKPQPVTVTYAQLKEALLYYYNSEDSNLPGMLELIKVSNDRKFTFDFVKAAAEYKAGDWQKKHDIWMNMLKKVGINEGQSNMLANDMVRDASNIDGLVVKFSPKKEVQNNVEQPPKNEQPKIEEKPLVIPNIPADNKPIPRPEPPKQAPIKPVLKPVPPQAGLNGAPKIPVPVAKPVAKPVPKIPVPVAKPVPVPKKEDDEKPKNEIINDNVIREEVILTKKEKPADVPVVVQKEKTEEEKRKEELQRKVDALTLTQRQTIFNILSGTGFKFLDKKLYDAAIAFVKNSECGKLEDIAKDSLKTERTAQYLTDNCHNADPALTADVVMQYFESLTSEKLRKHLADVKEQKRKEELEREEKVKFIKPEQRQQIFNILCNAETSDPGLVTTMRDSMGSEELMEQFLIFCKENSDIAISKASAACRAVGISEDTLTLYLQNLSKWDVKRYAPKALQLAANAPQKVQIEEHPAENKEEKRPEQLPKKEDDKIEEQPKQNEEPKKEEQPKIEENVPENNVPNKQQPEIIEQPHEDNIIHIERQESEHNMPQNEEMKERSDENDPEMEEMAQAAPQRRELTLEEKQKILKGAKKEILRLKGRLDKHWSCGKTMDDMRKALTGAKGQIEGAKEIAEITEAMDAALRKGTQYQTEKVDLKGDFSDWQLHRLKTINYLKAVDRMLKMDPPLDPESEEGHKYMLAVKLTMSLALRSEHGGQLCNSEHILEQADRVRNSEVFETFIEGKDVEKLLAARQLKSIRIGEDYVKHQADWDRAHENNGPRQDVGMHVEREGSAMSRNNNI